MTIVPYPPGPEWREADRLAALDRYGILDTPREPEFDDIARLAAEIFEAPIAAVNLIADGRQWFKAEVGIGARELPLSVSICAHAILQADILIVPDLRDDTLFSDNPLVTSSGGIRFYAGASLKTQDGLPIGTVCVLDTQPRPAGVSERQRLTLEVLARQVMTQLELRRVLRERTAEHGRTRRVLDGMAEGFGLLDREFRVVDINVEGLRLEERPREAIIGKTHWEAWPGTEDSELGRLYKRAMAERVPVSLDHHYVWPDGHEAWLEMRAYPTDDGLALFWRDVTDRKRAEIALERNEAFSREVLAASQDCIKVLTLDGRLEVMSEGGRRALFINDIAPFVGVCWAETFEPDGRASAHAAINEARSGGSARFEAGLKTQQNELRWWDTLVSPIFGEDGRPEKLLALSRDVTEKKQAQEALREREARFAFLDQLGAETASIADADAILATTTRLLGEHLKLSICAYADMDQDQDGFTIRGDWAAPGSNSIVGHYSLADFGQLAVTNLSAGLPLVVHDNARELAPEEAATFQNIGIAATICMPLVKEGRLVALMAIHDRAPRVWTEAELSLLREVTARSWAHVERVGATAELRESEARFRLMADAVPQIVWITDPDGRTEFFNKQWTDYTGAPYQPATAAQVAANFVHPDDAGPTTAAFDEARRTAGTFLVEHRIRSKAGEYRWFLVRGEPYRDARTGEVVRWFGASVDIDDRKLAEERLREVSRRLDAILSNTRMAVFLMDDRQHCLFANPAAEQLTGYSFRELQSRPLHDVIHHKRPDGSHYPLEECPIDRAFPKRAQMEGEELFVAPDGGFYPVAFTASPVLDHAGKPVGTVIEARNIAEEKARDAALRELNETLERRVDEALAERKLWADVFQSTDALIAALSPDHRFLALNGAYIDEFERIFGVRPDIGDDLGEVLRSKPEHQAAALAVWDRALAGEEFVVTEEFGDPERDRPYYELRFNTLRDRDGKLIGAFQYAVDVSERLRTQAKLTEAEEQLRQSQKLEAMGQLTGGVAHDFNNLLTPIVGSLDMLVRRGVGSERERRLIDGALQSAERAKTLVQRLLAFARRQPLQPTAVDIARLVEGMTGLIGSTLGPTIDVRLNLSGDLPPAKADPNQLEMALLNLAVNARDAMPAGGELTVSAKRESVHARHDSGLKPGHYVRLSVSDTGVGMDQATLERAIEPFFSTKGVGRGTGLGLSMVHGLASQLNGGLTIASRPDEGTVVDLWLPISPVVAEDGEEPTMAAPVSSGRGTALLVDDEELVRMSTADMLADLGYEVVETDSAERALRLIEDGLYPDLLVTDHLMPGMNGADLAREFRSRRPDTPVLIISGYAEVDGIAPDLPRLTKPFRNAELAASLNALTGVP